LQVPGAGKKREVRKMRSWEKDGGWKLGNLEGNNLPGTIIPSF
jgi:hypothetical protein